MIFKQVILLLLVGALLVVLWEWRPTAEGFSDTPSQSSPLEDWINYFHYRLGTPNKYRDDTNMTESAAKNRKEIPIDPSIPLNFLNDALATPMGGGSAKDNDVSRYFFHMDTGELTTADKQCRQLPHPRNIGPRSGGDPETVAGCGWWYVEDPNTASTGAFGRQTGPDAPNTTLPVGGRWVWDTAEATKLESIKRCRRIRTCDSIAATAGECGFCTESNRGVPVTATGTVAYPTDPYGSCGSTPVTDTAKCQSIKYNLVVDRYDFNYDANGNVVDGKDTSLMRLIERDGMGRATSVCDADSAGRISRDCLKGLATDAGLLPTGAVLRMIEAGAIDANNESDTVAIQYLQQNSGVAGLAQLQTIVAQRTVKPANAATMFREIAALENSAANELVRDAAKWLVRGTPFDVCKFRDRDVGPFPLRCIQREFRKAGCQASGAAYPSAAAAAAPSFAGLTMGAIRSQFRDLFLKMTNSSPTDLREQDDAVKACLGIQLQREAETVWTPGPNTCRDPGIEYFLFEYGPPPAQGPAPSRAPAPASAPGSPPSIAPYVLGTPLPSDTCPTPDVQPTLIGYYVHEKAQLVSSQTASEAVANIIGILSTVPNTHRRGYLARCIIEVGDVPNTLLTVRANAKHSLRVNGVDAPLNRAIRLQQRQRNLVELQFIDITNKFETPLLEVQRGGTAVFGPLLNQSIWKPMISIGMTNNRLNDLNGILCFPPTTTTDLGQAVVNRDLKWRLPTIAAITMHFTLTRLPATGNNTLFRFDAGTEGASEQCLKVTIENGGFLVVTLTTTRGAFQTRTKRALTTANVGSAVQHVAIVPDARATQIYLNGEDITDMQTIQTPIRDGAAAAQIVFSRLKIGTTAGATLRRFNIYNRALSAPQVVRDRRMDDPTLSEDTTEIPTAATTPASLGFATQSGRVVRAGAGTVSPIPSVRVRDANMCARRCADQGNDCLAFQYDGRVGPDVANCDMYKFLNTDTDLGAAVSGTGAGLVTLGTKSHTTEPQIRFRGPPLVTDTGIVSFEACGNKCVGNAACAGFTFERDPRIRSTRGTCTQFRAITRREKDPRAAFNALASGRMSKHTDTMNQAAIRGGCPTGMYAFGSKGRCCATEPQGVLYDQCRQGECGTAATDTQVAACGPVSA